MGPLNRLIKRLRSALRVGLERRDRLRRRTEVVKLRPADSVPRGRALLAYALEPFLHPGRPTLSTHTKFGESLLMAEALLRLGFEVDVIDFENQTYRPSGDYDLLISARKHFQLYATLVGDRCLKIVHLDTSHWLFNNQAALRRCQEVQEKRGVALNSYRLIEENWAIEHADLGIMLGNAVSIGSYSYAGKVIYPVTVPSIRLYPEPKKDFEAVRRNFIWLGSRGCVHKGLDLVLEAFAGMPEFNLVVYGPVEKEPDFMRAYDRELRCGNIRLAGWVDVTGDQFIAAANNALGLVYPSCAEGQAGAVVTCMQAGLIPMVSRQAGVDVDRDYGLLLGDLSVGEIRARVREIAALPGQTLEAMSLQAWAYARRHHSPESYSTRYEGLLRSILEEAQPGRVPGGDYLDARRIRSSGRVRTA